MSPRETAAQRAERMDRAAAGRNRGEGRPERRVGVVRTKPVRLTVDMQPALHRRLKAFSAQAAAELDVADVAAAEVVRALVARLTLAPEADGYDAELVAAVMQHLRDRTD